MKHFENIPAIKEEKLMPIPKPNKGESKDDFIDRCMSDDKMVDEYKRDQRYAICMSKWEDKNEDNSLVKMLDKLEEKIKQ